MKKRVAGMLKEMEPFNVLLVFLTLALMGNIVYFRVASSHIHCDEKRFANTVKTLLRENPSYYGGRTSPDAIVLFDIKESRFSVPDGKHTCKATAVIDGNEFGVTFSIKPYGSGEKQVTIYQAR